MGDVIKIVEVREVIRIVDVGGEVIKIETMERGLPGPPGSGSGGSSATPSGTTSGTTSALTVTLGLTTLPSASEARLAVVTFHAAPDAGATLNPDGLGALPLRTPADVAIGAGAVTPGITLPVLIRSDRVQLILL